MDRLDIEIALIYLDDIDEYRSCREYKTIKKALEKQLAMEPVYSDFSDNGFGVIIPYKAKCPVCGYEFEFSKWNDEESHHCICGQKMDWSDEE